MLLSKNHMLGATVQAPDGRLGELRDLLFDERWNIRHLVVAGGKWTQERRITLPPTMIQEKSWTDSAVVIAGLTCRQVIESPETEQHLPVRQPGAFGEATTEAWDIYWIHLALHPWQVASDAELRSVEGVMGYHVMGMGAALGHVADFIIDDEAWVVRSLAVDTRLWRKGKTLLVAPAAVKVLDWETRTMQLALSRESLAGCPEMGAAVPELPRPLSAGRV